jgi:aspartyl/asparaginyl beta-hydroxylase (cupin superfamily)
VFEEIYYTLQKYYTLGRVRLMQSKPKTCLTWHNDNSKRIHLPIKTNAGCQMVIENQVQHMPAGTWWLTDTTVPHTAFNASTESRIHLVAVVLEEL